jgi:hypothetical protein
MRFVVAKTELGQVFSLAKHSIDCSTLIINHHLGLVQ